MTTMARRLRDMLAGPELAVLPGCYDCITGRAIERNGFRGAYVSGGGTSFSMGFPDYGLITMTEMVENAGQIAAALDIPVISDADTGFGNPLNVTRTVRAFEQRGIAGIHIEDQDFPKKCGHLNDKKLISRDDFAKKIRAAVDARSNPDFVIIARTDACGVTGFDDAIDRANAALDAGADVAFVEALRTLDETAAAPRRVKGPCLLNIVWNGKSPNVSVSEAREMGYRIAIAPGLLLRSVMIACDEALGEFGRTGRFPEIDRPWGVQDTFAFNGAAAWDALSKKYA